MTPNNPIDSFIYGYPEIDLKKVVKEVFAAKESHLSYLEIYSNYLGICWHRSKEFIPKDFTKGYRLETLQQRYFVIPITLDFDKCIENTPQFNFNNLLPFEKDFVSLTINYIRTALQHQILFDEVLSMKSSVSDIDDIAYICVDFNFIGDSVEFRLIGFHDFSSFDNFSSSLRFLDPRLLALMMEKLGNSHDKFKSLGINIAHLKEQTNQEVFKDFFKSETESKPMQNPKNLKGDQPIVVPENTIIMSEQGYNMPVEENPLKTSLGDKLITKLKPNTNTPTERQGGEKMMSVSLHKALEDKKKSNTTEKAHMTNVRNGYKSLAAILERSLDQAQNGKGNERHQVGEATFTKQPICELGRLYGTGYNFGQAAKKAHETNQLGTKEAKLNEIYGAINYLAAAAILIEEGD